MDVTLTIPKVIREGALRAADRAGILGFQLTVFITLAPNIDHLSSPKRVEFWRTCLNRLRAYCRKREKKLGIPFPAVYLATRESDPITHLGEHLHLLAHAPDRAEADHMAVVVRNWFKKKRRKATARGGTVEGADGSVDGDAVGDPNAAHAKRVDTRERLRGGKLRSVVRYVFKAAHPQSWKFDSTILWKLSGAIAGPRVFISRNITNREVVAATRDAVDAIDLARQGLIRAGRDADVPAPAPSSATATTPPAATMPVEVHAAAVPAIPAVPPPVLAAAAAAAAEPEPEPIEPAIYSGSGLASFVHRDEAEHRGMDVVEIEIHPAEPAATEPALVLRGPAMTDTAPATAHAEVMELVEDVTPATPPPAPPAFVTEPATATSALIVSPDVPAEAIASTPASATTPSTSSSPNAVLASLAGLGRAVARTAAAGVGWVASRLGARPPLSPTSAARRLRAPLFQPSTFIAAGTFFGAPNVVSDPW